MAGYRVTYVTIMTSTHNKNDYTHLQHILGTLYTVFSDITIYDIACSNIDLSFEKLVVAIAAMNLQWIILEEVNFGDFFTICQN